MIIYYFPKIKTYIKKILINIQYSEILKLPDIYIIYYLSIVIILQNA